MRWRAFCHKVHFSVDFLCALAVGVLIGTLIGAVFIRAGIAPYNEMAGGASPISLPAELLRAVGVAPGTETVAEVQSGCIVLGSVPMSLAEQIVARANALPPDALDGLPDDLAAQHDHYLYGTPKRPE
jgi:hypothetical protein